MPLRGVHLWSRLPMCARCARVRTMRRLPGQGQGQGGCEGLRRRRLILSIPGRASASSGDRTVLGTPLSRALVPPLARAPPWQIRRAFVLLRLEVGWAFAPSATSSAPGRPRRPYTRLPHVKLHQHARSTTTVTATTYNIKGRGTCTVGPLVRAAFRPDFRSDCDTLSS